MPVAPGPELSAGSAPKQGNRIASATPPAAEVLTIWTAITSDGFSGDGSMASRAADLAGGGSAATWAETVANAVATSGGKLTFGSNLASALTYVPTTATNICASIRVNASTTASAWYLIAMRTNLVSGSALQLRAVFTNMSVKLGKVINGTATYLSGRHTVTAGDLVQVEKVGSTIKLIINGVTLETVTDSSVTSNAYAGIANSSGGGTLTLDDFKIEFGA
ncbi:hypothetical protein [Arthrobacter sp. ISL-69]|uniref:hypothetical protein n=1 Tax=Arthrobacter sp. ISL-69 TaxID=2819113 RepID=UPI001BEBA7F3|nr:hypothetical protein [Arthrobacter sp. ISL-69]MBT2538286.1 hypothetical protein [Arthrobacter sp. ISL-69]